MKIGLKILGAACEHPDKKSLRNGLYPLSLPSSHPLYSFRSAGWGEGVRVRGKRNFRYICLGMLMGWLPFGLHAAVTASGKEPVYIGAQACAECHEGAEMGYQFSIWLKTAHANAYATLALPESRAIAELSGITEHPQKARQCLGCHATAADVEEWEREQGFFIQDGLQCEKCHGPGSEYANSRTMKNREQALANGLILPDKESCMVCHRIKGSHEAVLKTKPYDLEAAWNTIAHPVPKEKEGLPEQASEDSPPKVSSGKFKFTGVMACATCHQGQEMGYQLSKWRLGPHAKAYASLASVRAGELAAEAGVIGDPIESERCLSCHSTGSGFDEDSFQEGFSIRDGVQCESCHGPGSEYSPEAVMLDSEASHRAGLQAVTEKTCLVCHEKAHGKPFDFKKAVAKVSHPKKLSELTQTEHYKTPLNLALTPDGKELWVACEASDSVIVVDAGSHRKVAEILVGGQPTDVTFDQEGKRAFVSNRLDDSVSVIGVGERKVRTVLEVGDEPHGVLLDREGRHLYVLNTSTDSISVFDALTLQEIKRLTTSRSPWSLALSPDGRRILVSNALSRFVPERTPSMSEVTVIDTERAIVVERGVIPGANLLQGVAWHPSGQYAVITLNRTKNLVPMTRLLQGWTISNGIGIVWRDGTVDQVLLDHPHLCFPDPADVVVTPDGRYALVTSSGSDRVAVVDLPKLTSMLRAATPYERERVFPNHLGKPTEFVAKFIKTKNSPRGITCSADGSTAYVANSLDDSVTVIDLNKLEAVARIDLGGPKEITKVRFGERLFHSANVCFRRQFSCHTCHPDGHIDGITYDIEPDGLGIGPVDNRTLRGINDMAPYKWEGTNPTLQRQCGPRLAVFFTRIQPFTSEELAALENYICTIPRPPNRYRNLGAKLTPTQRRGKAMYERTRTNPGSLIPVANRCTTCHPPPLYTDGRRHDVGTKTALDREGRFDAPHLLNIYDSAPYLHNGMAPSLEEIWTRFNVYDEHGVTNDMTKDQLNDLIVYLKTL